MTIDIDYQKVEVPQEIIAYCYGFTYDAVPGDLRFTDCVNMNMGLYGNDPEQLKELRNKILPVFE